MSENSNRKRTRQEEILDNYFFAMRLLSDEARDYIYQPDGDWYHANKISCLYNDYLNRLAMLNTVPPEHRQEVLDMLQKNVLDAMQNIVNNVEIKMQQRKRASRKNIIEYLKSTDANLKIHPNFPILSNSGFDTNYVMENSEFKKIFLGIINNFNVIMVETNNIHTANEYAISALGKLTDKVNEYKRRRKQQQRLTHDESKNPLYLLTRQQFAESGINIPDDFPIFYMEDISLITDDVGFTTRLTNIIDKFNHEKQNNGLQIASDNAYDAVRTLKKTAYRRRSDRAKRLAQVNTTQQQPLPSPLQLPLTQQLPPQPPYNIGLLPPISTLFPPKPAEQDDTDLAELLRETLQEEEKEEEPPNELDSFDINFDFERGEDEDEEFVNRNVTPEWENMPEDFGVSGQPEWNVSSEEHKKGGKKKKKLTIKRLLRRNKKTLKKRKNKKY